MSRLIDQLVGRGVARVGAAYLALSWLLLQIIHVLSNMLEWPGWVGVSPDGNPMILRDHSIHNIYALKWRAD